MGKIDSLSFLVGKYYTDRRKRDEKVLEKKIEVKFKIESKMKGKLQKSNRKLMSNSKWNRK